MLVEVKKTLSEQSYHFAAPNFHLICQQCSASQVTSILILFFILWHNKALDMISMMMSFSCTAWISLNILTSHWFAASSLFHFHALPNFPPSLSDSTWIIIRWAIKSHDQFSLTLIYHSRLFCSRLSSLSACANVHFRIICSSTFSYAQLRFWYSRRLL